MVTVDVNPTPPSYGKIVHRAPVPGQHEAHHAGFTDDRRYLWAGGLDTTTRAAERLGLSRLSRQQMLRRRT